MQLADTFDPHTASLQDVALAAFAAASITKQDPMATGFAAVRIGVVMFVIPFVFAMYPQLLIIEQAVLDPAATTEKAYLPGHDGTLNVPELLWIVARLLVALYLLASALARFDARPLASWEFILRLFCAGAIMASAPMVHGGALIAAIALIVLHRMRGGTTVARTAD